ncbi:MULTISPECIES: methyltransferase domain-containing protein [unclassified Corallococcus]|uniref:methyltransferase domain-containing protein n=1 Tax=unclassified Corallococcus TaxID=2685029 RepID=UPI001A90C087|nr:MULTISPECIES: methyltransferase domain-containing protein [unclassified Corallococcus]MBN9686414.1 class I SAM-dependent methyltransferase [Corallococcus sp. NCSPR001]WAS82158.1 methyltransferase domain-containing protein [Corallococcus sp. NCRR]
MSLGVQWALLEQFAFVQENVEPELLLLDVRARPELQALWAALQARALLVTEALDAAGDDVAQQLRTGDLSPARFREQWEGLGFIEATGRASTAADDWLEGLLRISRITTGQDRPPFGQVNMASRAQRISDFLSITSPGPRDVVYDLGCGNGKFAITVAASSSARVKGVEYGQTYVESARRNSQRFALPNLEFIHADVRDVDMSDGTAFYLYFPFWGEVAHAVARMLGDVAKTRDITVYASGPRHDYGEHFLEQVSQGALYLAPPRHDFADVMVLRSAAFA